MIHDYTLTIEDGVNKVAFDTVAEVTDADYSWSTTAVLRRKVDRALFFVTDFGCSCNSFGDYLTVADLKPLFKFSDAKALCGNADEWVRLRNSRQQREVVYR